MSKIEAVLSATEMLAAVPYFTGLEVECAATLEGVIRQEYKSGQDGGLIKVERRQIHIVDRPGLERKAQDEE